jgi:hypothetical protein
MRLYQAIPDTYAPTPADKSALGTLPTRGFRHCEPLRAASGFGWYCYPPADLAFQWDGAGELEWWIDGAAVGSLPPAHARQYPDFAKTWNATAPVALEGQSYPMVIRGTHEYGMLQVWTGWCVRTPADWSSLIRPLVNVAPPVGFSVYEGIIETDSWFGPLFANLILTKTDTRIELPKHRPFFQLQMIPRAAYAKHETDVIAFGDWTAREWDDYFETVVKPNRDPERQRGAYAIHSRQRPASS